MINRFYLDWQVGFLQRDLKERVDYSTGASSGEQICEQSNPCHHLSGSTALAGMFFVLQVSRARLLNEGLNFV